MELSLNSYRIRKKFSHFNASAELWKWKEIEEEVGFVIMMIDVLSEIL